MTESSQEQSSPSMQFPEASKPLETNSTQVTNQYVAPILPIQTKSKNPILIIAIIVGILLLLVCGCCVGIIILGNGNKSNTNSTSNSTTVTPTIFNSQKDKEKFAETKAIEGYDKFCKLINAGDFQGAYTSSSDLLQETLTFSDFKTATSKLEGCTRFQPVSSAGFEISRISGTDNNIIYVYGDFYFDDGSKVSGRVSLIEIFNNSEDYLLLGTGDEYQFNGFKTF